MQTYLIQWFLLKSGYNPGPIDGAMGPITRSAIAAFQADRGFHVDGKITAALIEVFNAEVAPGRWPIWLHHALGYVGLEEIPGVANNPTIMGWAMDLNVNYAGDHIAWCGLFVAAMLKKAAPGIVLPENILGAREYRTVGHEIDTASVSMGDLMVFWRGSKSDWRGHVGFYMGMAGGSILVLGGNQSNKVSIDRQDRQKLLAIRRPSIPESSGLFA